MDDVLGRYYSEVEKRGVKKSVKRDGLSTSSDNASFGGKERRRGGG